MSKVDYVELLLLQIRGAGLPPPELEVPFTGMTGKRKYRWDFAYPKDMVAVEYQGGTLTGGVGHTSISGMKRDQAKASEGAACGWRVLWVNAATVESGEALQWLEMALWGER